MGRKEQKKKPENLKLVLKNNPYIIGIKFHSQKAKKESKLKNK